MRNIIFILFFIFLLFATNYATDIKAERIVSLYSAYTEILQEIGAKDLIVGATRHDAKKLGIPSVGNHMNPSIEAVISCNPDFVIAFAKDSLRFEKMGLYLKKNGTPFLVIAPTTVVGVKSLILKLGDITGQKQRALEVVDNIDFEFKNIDSLILLLPNKKIKKVFVEVRQAPTFLTCGRESIVADILKRLNCNVVAVGEKSVNIVGVEKIINANPDFYLQQIGMMNRNPIPPNKERFVSSLSCVKLGKFGTIKEKLISRPGINIGKAAIEIYKMIYETGEKNE